MEDAARVPVGGALERVMFLSWQKALELGLSFNSHGSQLKMAHADKDKNFIARNGGPTRLENHF